MESSTKETDNKKDPFEELSKEELIKKCRQFLSIAQKARQAKDVLTEENKTISKKLEDLENSSQKDIKAMQEMLNVLTQQKLQLVTENDSLSKQKVVLNTEIKNYKQELIDVNTKMQDLDTENQHYNRQVGRLTDENEKLISHLDTLEKRIDELNKIGEQLREQLLLLEKRTAAKDESQEQFNQKSDSKESCTKFEELTNKCSKYETEIKNMKIILLQKDEKLENLCEEIDTLKMKNDQINQLKNFCQLKNNEIETLNIKINELNNIISNLNEELDTKNNTVELLTKNFDDLQNELEITKKAKDHYNEKFKSYHCKLVKVFTDLKEIKKCKNNLLIVIQDYSKHITKWQTDIKLVSEKFKQEIENRDSENNELNSRIIEMQNKLSEITGNKDEENSLIKELKTELKNKDIELNNIILEKNKLLEDIISSSVKMEEIKNAVLEKEELVLEKNKLAHTLKTQKDKIDSLYSENFKALEEINSLKETIKLLQESDVEKYTLLEKDNERLISTIAEKDEKMRQVEETIQFMLQAKDELQKELSNHWDKIQFNEKTIDLLTDEKRNIITLINKNSKKLATMENISSTIENLLSEKKQLETKLEEEINKYHLLVAERDNLISEKQSLLEEININNKKLQDLENVSLTSSNLKQEKDQLEIELQKENDKIEKLAQEKNQLEKEISELKNSLNDFRDQLRSTNKGTALNIKEKSELTEKNKILDETISKYDTELSSIKFDLSQLQDQLSLSKRENVELLKEMNVMNQALKERGETISKQQEYSQELIRKIQNLELEGDNKNQEKTKLEEEIANLKTKVTQEDLITHQRDSMLDEKNERIKTLEQEIHRLKESFNSSIGRENQDDTETMSTSTISKADEAGRLRDLEGSWEERYSKLRTLALKLKGKVKEQNEHLTQERNDKTEIQNKLTTITRNLQTVQTEYDKIQDQFDIVNKENSKNVKQIESLTNENDKIKQDLLKNTENVNRLQSELESLRKEKIGSNTAVKQYTNQIQQLKKDIEDSGNIIKELEIKISKMENTISSKEIEFQNEIKSHNSTKEKLQKIEKEIKKNSVLSLEMEDYERSLKDMTQKLDKKNEIISDLEETNNAQSITIKSLQDQIQICEEKITEGEKRCLNLEKQLLESQTKISSVEATIAQKENRIREIMKTLEDYKIKSEEENSELSEIVSQNQKQLDQLKTEKDHLKSLILGLEEKMKELTKISSDREQELIHVQKEFSSYKVRAQSVLRQNQTRDISSEERLFEEVNQLKSENEQLSTQLDQKSSELKTLKIQFDQITNEKSQVIIQFQELEKMLAKETSDNSSLLDRQQQLIAEHRETIRAQKVHTDTLAQCYKQQLAEQEERHIKEITELKATQMHSNIHNLSKSQDETVDIASMPREDAEGSESVDSNTNNQFSKSTILSLDKLLNSDIENSSTPDYEVELLQCKKRIVEFEAKVKHLTDLLADTEQDLAKHAQLNQLLKEEIRRHQRSVEREKHAENLEYLKNVVFKFLTLNSGDEKSHLVPVLNTILKLSPDETQKLNSVAKGSDITGRGWGSYLPIWSGSNNNH